MSNIVPKGMSLPMLPLLLWRTPPGLELILAQEGVAYKRIQHFHPLSLQAGRFVLFDSRQVPAAWIRSSLSPEHVGIDVDLLRSDEPADPFRALVDLQAGLAQWTIGGLNLMERIGRFSKAPIRRRMVNRLREVVTASDGTWARLTSFPFPFRSAFNLRVDLDETHVEDYARFAQSRRQLADCTTHFVSTRAYGTEPEVLKDLLRYDTQSHGHHHVVYRDKAANRKNLIRADAILRESGFQPSGFASPHGRWNAGLDEVMEELGYHYSSDFQLGYDDLPFHPYLGSRFSSILQVPVHPICEGLFLEAGVSEGQVIAEHLVKVVRAKIGAGEPAFVYGHPEGRLARHPEILDALADAIEGETLLWRVTLTEFADWWRWRGERSWSLLPRADGRVEVQFDDWSAAYPLGLEIQRGRHVCRIPLDNVRTTIRLDDLVYESQDPPVSLPAPRFASRTPSLRAAVRSALDWETVTPLDELPVDSLPARLKKGLRTWRQSRRKREPEGAVR